jgi:hypothetical protein
MLKKIDCILFIYLFFFVVKLRIPDDGNLYNFSTKKFVALLDCLKLDHQVITACSKRKMDGKQFSRLSELEMEMSGLMNPLLIHFRRLTVKPQKTTILR